MTDDLAIYKHHRVEAHELLSEFRCFFDEPWVTQCTGGLRWPMSSIIGLTT